MVYVDMTKRTNKNWRLAYAWVTTQYPELITLPRSIRFLPATYKQGAYGRYLDYTVADIQEGTIKPGNGYVQIYGGNRTVIDFIHTLVHELTHARQHKEGKHGRSDMLEVEARQEGWKAAQRYQYCKRAVKKDRGD